MTLNAVKAVRAIRVGVAGKVRDTHGALRVRQVATRKVISTAFVFVVARLADVIDVDQLAPPSSYADERIGTISIVTAEVR